MEVQKLLGREMQLISHHVLLLVWSSGLGAPTIPAKMLQTYLLFHRCMIQLGLLANTLLIRNLRHRGIEQSAPSVPETRHRKPNQAYMYTVQPTWSECGRRALSCFVERKLEGRGTKNSIWKINVEMCKPTQWLTQLILILITFRHKFIVLKFQFKLY